MGTPQDELACIIDDLAVGTVDPERVGGIPASRRAHAVIRNIAFMDRLVRNLLDASRRNGRRRA